MRALVVLALAACDVSAPYPCSSSVQCTHGTTLGYCETTGFCSFDDASCDSQRRYDVSADALSSACVEGIVTGHVRQRYVTNDEQFAPVVNERGMPAATAMTAVTLADGAMPNVSYRETDGAFSFPDPDHLAYDLVVAGTHYQLSQPHVELAERTAGRPERTAVTKSTPIRFQYTNNPAGNTVIASTGLWTQTTNGSQTSFTFDWKSATSSSGALGLLDATQRDLMYLTKVEAQNGYSAITGVGTASVTLADGVMTVVPAATLDTPLLDQCVHVVVPEVDTSMRLLAAVPRSYTAAVDWGIEAEPAIDALGRVGALDVVTGTAGALANIDRTVTLHDPFVGTTLVASTELRATYTIPYSGTTGVSGINVISVSAPFAQTGGCATDVATLASTVGIAGPITVAGTPVTSDEQMVTIDLTQRVPITWTAASAGTVHVHVVDLYELSNSGSGPGAITTAIDEVETTDPSYLLDPTLLAKGHTYLLYITELRGIPNAASGDLATFTFPVETSATWTRSFVVR